jgi:hypothetical protein
MPAVCMGCEPAALLRSSHCCYCCCVRPPSAIASSHPSATPTDPCSLLPVHHTLQEASTPPRSRCGRVAGAGCSSSRGSGTERWAAQQQQSHQAQHQQLGGAVGSSSARLAHCGRQRRARAGCRRVWLCRTGGARGHLSAGPRCVCVSWCALHGALRCLCSLIADCLGSPCLILHTRTNNRADGSPG